MAQMSATGTAAPPKQSSPIGLPPHVSKDTSNSGNSQDLEAEMRRLKLELKQTMDLYSAACKEAILAKKKAKELHEWKMEEAHKFEEARLAIEAAKAAQRLAELEAQKRRHAELKAKREAEEKNRALSVLKQMIHSTENT